MPERPRKVFVANLRRGLDLVIVLPRFGVSGGFPCVTTIKKTEEVSAANFDTTEDTLKAVCL